MDCLWYNGLGGEEKSGDVRWQAADTADGKAVARLLDAVMTLHGRLDFAFNKLLVFACPISLAC